MYKIYYFRIRFKIKFFLNILNNNTFTPQNPYLLTILVGSSNFKTLLKSLIKLVYSSKQINKLKLKGYLFLSLKDYH